ncbi:hypothetical protein [Actinoalloteichus hymeniacidonis]|uniref:ABC-2 family transporter protein n=1 Tax=Actinoalloteichus hymeniacidonis TaxID=340345 RepID=A0AAC9HPM2_9PSEU|nr:hypothetical protein [Actinoalloteichus hymeniacidonis]AOS62240.1 ABC-2 family transporter protein [Actinoalloteichus hymeniacidonis]MBB5909734.1 hypothetical protein [Actinoalloteichus hymeniacidonis]
MNALRAELRKLLSLPATYLGTVIGFVATVFLAAIDAHHHRAALDSGRIPPAGDVPAMAVGFDLVAIGSIAAITIGVVVISSEYLGGDDESGGGRQILTTLVGAPRRVPLLAAKALAVALVTGLLAFGTILAVVAASQALLGGHGLAFLEAVGRLGWRVPGAVAFWMLTGLMVFAVTVITRSGVVPLIVFIINTAGVSLTYIAARNTSWGRFLPDVAGTQMFVFDYAAPDMLDPIPGGLVMLGWTAVLLAIAAIVFVRRDA